VSAFNDPRYLRASGAITSLPTVISDDRPCPKCGYNLIGLEVGNPCPECGRAIVSAFKKGLDDTIIDAPRAYLRRFSLALTASFLGLTLNVLGLFTVLSLAIVNSLFAFYGQAGANGIVGPQLRVPTPSEAFLASVFLFGSLVWLAGLIVSTLPRPTPPDVPESRAKEWKQLRIGVWISQSGWAFAAALILSLVLFGPSSSPSGTVPVGVGIIWTVALIVAIAALAGLCPTALLLARYADWIPDPELAWRLRTSAWSIGVFGATLVITGITPPGLPSFAGVFPFFLWLSVGFVWFFFLAGLAVLFWSLASMAKASWDAVGNQMHREERDQRMLERMRKEREEQLRRYDRVPHQEEPTPGVRKVGVAPRRPPAQG
jgi:hypothetical protein